MSNSVFLAKTDSFGDAFIGLRLVRAILESGKRLVWVCGPSAPEVLSLLNPPDRSVELIQTELEGYHFSTAPSDEFSRLARRLATYQFDVALCGTFSGNWVDELCVRIVRADRRFILRRPFKSVPPPPGLPERYRGRLAEVTPEFVPAFLPEVEAGRRLLARANIKLALSSPPPSRLGSERRHLLVAPGKRDSARAWLPASFAAAIASLRSSDTFAGIALLEGPLDAEACDAVEVELMAAGQTPIPRFAARPGRIAETARKFDGDTLLLCNDTGWMHLAVWLGSPCVALFGAASLDTFVPTDAPVTAIRSTIACEGCDWTCAFSTHRCVTEIPIALVVGAVVARAAEPFSPSMHLRHHVDDPTIASEMSAHIRSLVADRNAHIWECERLRSIARTTPLCDNPVTANSALPTASAS